MAADAAIHDFLRGNNDVDTGMRRHDDGPGTIARVLVNADRYKRVDRCESRAVCRILGQISRSVTN